jgi:hypothetical protein
MTDVATGIGLSGYVPTSRTLSINGVTYDLTANRSWTITTPYVSKLQHSVKAGVAINKGQAVYVTGADGTNMIVGLASNASEATSSKTMGLLDATVSTNSFANVVTEGLLAGLDTSTAGTEGDPVWLGTGGNLIYGLTNKPYAPAHLVFIGIVTRKNANNGEIFVKVQNGFELDELHDVDLKTTAPINGHLLGYNGTLWVNKTIAGWLGYTPANASGTTNYLSKFTGSTTLGNSLVYDNGTNVGIGTTSPAYKLDVNGTIGFPYSGSNANYIEQGNALGYGRIRPFNNSGLFGFDTNYTAGGGYDFAYNGSSVIRVTSAGNVGIGTTAPGYKLEVNGGPINIVNGYSEPTAEAGYRLKFADNGGINNDSGIGLSGSPGNESLWINKGSANGNIRFMFGTLGEKVTFTSAGNVGIGTTSPAYSLDVVGYIRSSQGYRFTPSSLGQFTISGGNTYFDYEGSFFLRAVPGYSNPLTVTAAGNVGIGTTTPSYKLDVAGDVQIQSSYWLRFANEWGIQQSGTNLNFGEIGSSDGVLYLKAGGNVGIGTTSPAAKLHVSSGEIQIGDSSSNFFGIRLSRTNTAIIQDAHLYSPSNNSPSVFYIEGGYYTSEASGAVTAANSGYAYYERYFGNGSSNSYKQLGFINVANGNFTSTNLVSSITMLSNGNVGIGTSSPVHNLIVNGNTGISINANGTTFPNIHRDATDGGMLLRSWNGSVFSTSVKITPSGNLGIGTISPESKLHVSVGSIFIDNNFSYRQKTSSGGNVGLIYIDSSNLMGIYDGKVNVTSAGNVGIGTTTPSQILSISRVSTDNYIKVEAGGQGANYSGLMLTEYGINWGWALRHNAATDLLHISYQDNTPTFTDAVTFLRSGNVGIGTASPTQKLQVDGALKLTSNPSVTADSSAAYFWNQGGVGPTIGGLKFQVQTNGATPAMTIDDSQRVGIGTTSPSEKLFVNVGTGALMNSTITYGTNTKGIVINQDEGGSYGTGLWFRQSGLTAGIGSVRVNSGDWATDLRFYTHPSATVNQNELYERMRINSEGNVGIGTVNPATRLEVNGVITTTGGNSTQWNTAYGWGNHANAGYLTSVSDVWVNTTGDTMTGTLSFAQPVGLAFANGQYIKDNSAGGLIISSGAAVNINGTSVTINTNTVWHAGNDGSGSGLDADTVDGVQADSIVYGNARGTNQSITNNNNDLDKTGYYTADGFTTKPSGVANWMYIEHIKLYNDNTAYQKQLGYDTYDDRMWVRTKSGGTWSSWKQIWTSDVFANNSSNWNTAYGWGNHSGLYASLAHTHSATDITSGTLASARLSGSYAIDISGASSTSNTLTREDNRTISPSELAAGQLKFGFTSWSNNGGNPYADFLHLRSYTDASGGNDNLVMFRKDTIGMRIWQQSWGSTTAYSSYVDVWTTANFTQTNVNNWNTSYGWGNHASAGYLTSVTAHTQAWSTITSTPTTISGYGITNAYTDAQIQNFFNGANAISGYNKSNWDTAYSWGNHASYSYATTSYVTTQINNLIAGAPGALNTLDELAAALGDDSNFATTVTNSIATKLPLAGGTMTGDINWTQTDRGLTWNMNTDGAYIKFYNTGDGDVNSRLEYATSDNGDEYHRWVIGGTEKMTLKWAGLTINGTITATGYNNTNWDTAYSSLANYLPLAGGTMSGSINMNGNNVINIGQVNATHAIFTNDGSSRVMYIRGSGNIIQFQDAAATDKWEIVGRDGEFYVYKSDGAGSGYKWRIDGVGNHTITGNLTVTGTITESSSIKLKENVETSEGNLEKVVNLRPVTYNKIGSETTELGLIAEEVAEVYPEFVQYDEDGDPIGVHYSRLTAALIGAVKQLTKRIETLENNG